MNVRMTAAEVGSIIEMVDRVWPASKWATEIKAEVSRRLAKLPVEFASVRAVLLVRAMSHKFKSVSPADVLGWVSSLVPEDRKTASAVEPGSLHQARVEQEVRALLVRLPDPTVLTACDFIQCSLPQMDAQRGNVQNRLWEVCDLARGGGYLEALEYSIFRHELLRAPGVKEWVNEQAESVAGQAVDGRVGQ